MIVGLRVQFLYVWLDVVVCRILSVMIGCYQVSLVVDGCFFFDSPGRGCLYAV